MSADPTRVLFVCLGNICRSPIAEGVMRDLVSKRGLQPRYTVDSAGTSSWHNGEPPHTGSIAIAQERGIDISAQVSAQVTGADRDRYDWFVAMDTQNRADLLAMGIAQERVVLLLEFVPDSGRVDVPDPYYDGGFGRVFDLVLQGCEAFLEHLES